MAAWAAAEWAGWICKKDGRARRVRTARIDTTSSAINANVAPIFAVDAGRLRKLERGAERIVDAIASGRSSDALCKRLAETEAQLEQMRATSRVIDMKAIILAIPAAIDRYRTLVVRKNPGRLA